MTAAPAVTAARVLPRRYVDSIVAMRLARDLALVPGVLDAAAVMGTPANLALLAEGPFGGAPLPETGPDDLVVVVRAVDADAAEAALGTTEARLTAGIVSRPGAPRTLDDALQRLPACTVVSISLPGEYAGAEARQALEAGRHVFCFSSDVALDDEVALKALASQEGLLCMGPDCGTAILGGVGLGFANVVRRGPVGVVGASGTGIQAVTSLLDAAGIGTSHAIGAGSRDLHEAVGAATTLAGMRALDADATTELIVVVSKPGDPGPTELVRKAAASASTPTILCVLGDPDADARTIDLAVALAAARLGRHDAVLGRFEEPPDRDALRDRIGPRRLVRGLFSGGSLCAESQVVFHDAGAEVASNTPLLGSRALGEDARGDGHCLVDLGTPFFTRGRPHPMIDARERVARLEEEAAREDVAVVLLDVVLGYNAASHPAAALAPAIRAATAPSRAGAPVVIASVVGTEADPQVRSHEIAVLRDAGALVAPTNATAAALALSLVQGGPS